MTWVPGVPSQLWALLVRMPANSGARECVAAVTESGSAVRTLIVGELPMTHVRHTYGIRARTNNRNGRKLHGYAELLAALASAEGETEFLHLVVAHYVAFTVFSDPEIATLHGVLVGSFDPPAAEPGAAGDVRPGIAPE